MSLLDVLGGPGWFSDIFLVEISIDGDRLIDSHSLLFQEKCPLVSSEETLTGRVKIEPPPGRKVWHGGVTVRLDWTVSFFESLTTTENKAFEQEIVPAGYIGEATEVAFEIDMAKVAAACLETYDGEMFSVRHAITVNITRPWYTFDVMRSLIIALHKIKPAPATEEHFIDDDLNLQRLQKEREEAEAEAAAAPAADDGSGPPPPPPPKDGADSSSTASVQVERQPTLHRLRVIDAAEGLEMRYARACYNLGENFEATVYLGGGVPAWFKLGPTQERSCERVAKLAVKLFKIESGDGEAHEVIIQEHEIKVPGAPAMVAPSTAANAGVTIEDLEGTGAPPSSPGNAGAGNPVAPEAAGADAADATTTADAGVHLSVTDGGAQEAQRDPSTVLELPVSFPLASVPKGVPLGPTILDDALQVHYLVRLEAKDPTGVAVWNTHEIFLFRAGLASETI